MILSTAASVWILTVTLSSAPDSPKYYEFPTETECNQVRPFLNELYLSLGEDEVNTSCREAPSPEKSPVPLPVSFIL